STRSWGDSMVPFAFRTIPRSVLIRRLPGIAAAAMVLVYVAHTIAAGPGILFESSWDTATGLAANAVKDGGKWVNYWEFNGGSSVQLLSVVSGGVSGHNALRVQQRGSS